MEATSEKKAAAPKRKKRAKAETVRVAVDKYGHRYRVTGTDGKYLYCEGGIQFLHASGVIVRVEEEIVAAEHTADSAEVNEDGD